eukprot:5839806-Amphidinium_carterae.1
MENADSNTVAPRSRAKPALGRSLGANSPAHLTLDANQERVSCGRCGSSGTYYKRHIFIQTHRNCEGVVNNAGRRPKP